METQDTCETVAGRTDGAKAVREVRWFGAMDRVVREGDEVQVWVGTTMVAQFHGRDEATRNAVMVLLAQGEDVHLGQLAAAFGRTTEALRQVRRQYEREGLAAVARRRRGGAFPKLTAKHQEVLRAQWAAGVAPKQAHAALGGRPSVGVSRVDQLFRAWRREQGQRLTHEGRNEPSADGSAEPVPAPTPMLPGIVTDEQVADEPPRVVAVDARPEVEALVGVDAPGKTSDVVLDESSPVCAAAPTGGGFVQHAGAWLLLGLLEAHGLYAEARHAAHAEVDDAAARIALDAFAIALAIGEGCVEGVRRLATPTGATLLRADRTPSAPWVRKTLGALAEAGAATFQTHVAERYIRGARERQGDETGGPTVFYIDNHLRPYTGKEVLRRGWRMQARRVLPGTTDYYLHDSDGNPLYRFEAPHHASLPEFLAPATTLLRQALGDQARILIAFDRAGAFPEALAGLRDRRFEFVTYERRPYQLLAPDDLVGRLVLNGEKYTFNAAPAAKNLGRGRGRVERIVVRDSQGRQINLLTLSSALPADVIGYMFGRWCQENGLKHGVERWGQNQLDARTVEAYPPDTVVPNPARRRLDHALHLARAAEGQARCKLVEPTILADAGKRRKVEADLARALALQERLIAERASTPSRARLVDTELAGKLVKHKPDYKRVLDTVRVACMNAENELADLLAPHLARPREAKKLLAALFAAPAKIALTPNAVRVTPHVAATRREREAIAALLTTVNARGLRLPGDAKGRNLVFRSQL
jgi:transposase